MTLVPVTPAHLPAITDILKQEVLHHTNNFDWEAPTQEVVEARVKAISAKYPYWVALVPDEHGVDQVAGMAYASSFRDKASYYLTVESTIYLHPNYQGKGVARPLYLHLLNSLKAQGLVTVVACITLENEVSIKFHERLGFLKTGEVPKAGTKFSRWLDIGFWVLDLTEWQAPA